ncbi:MAG: polyprenyl synthetase family protein, partial [Akkermansia sp.]
VAPTTLHKAMRYSLFAGGKRIRPLLCLQAAKACGGSEEAALNAACALEVLHTYTLIHDDLPCMDDDDLRRGRPTNHKVFGEGIAVLAGDALLTEAFAILARVPGNERYDVGDYVAELAYRTGSLNLVGGQVLDLEGEGRRLNLDELRAIHNGKTAALLMASVRLGGMSAGCTAEQLDALTDYGRDLGLAFQIIDDILDVISTPEVMGKSIGKDAREQKATYPALMGLEAARAEARALTASARAALEVFSAKRREPLLAISDYLLKRDY